jgi:hypothetical protein
LAGQGQKGFGGQGVRTAPVLFGGARSLPLAFIRGCIRKKKNTMVMQRIVLISLVVFLAVVSLSTAVYAAESVTVTGEVIDTYCYSMAGAKGEAHRQCALECAKKGIPLGLLEDGTNKVYVLLPSKNASPLPPSVIDNMARKVTITGKVVESGGSRFVTVESVKS